MKTNLKSAILVTAALGLSGCALGPKHQPPAAATPTDWRWKTAAPNDEAPRGDWWTAFHDATLNELESKAVANNQNLKMAMPHHHRVQHAAGATTVPDVQAAMAQLGVSVPITEEVRSQVYTLSK